MGEQQPVENVEKAEPPTEVENIAEETPIVEEVKENSVQENETAKKDDSTEVKTTAEENAVEEAIPAAVKEELVEKESADSESNKIDPWGFPTTTNYEEKEANEDKESTGTKEPESIAEVLSSKDEEVTDP